MPDLEYVTFDEIAKELMKRYPRGVLIAIDTDSGPRFLSGGPLPRVVGLAELSKYARMRNKNLIDMTDHDTDGN